MDLSGIPPPVMNWDASNLPEEWQMFKLHVSSQDNVKLRLKKNMCLIYCYGLDKRDVKYMTWTGISDADPKKLDTYYTRFKNHVQPKLNHVICEMSLQ